MTRPFALLVGLGVSLVAAFLSGLLLGQAHVGGPVYCDSASWSNLAGADRVQSCHTGGYSEPGRPVTVYDSN